MTSAVATPAERVDAAVQRWGEPEVVRRCASLLRLHGSDDVVGDGRELAMVLGGVSEPDWLSRGKAPGHAYWARVWAARALLYVWEESVSGAVISALHDEQWRVREMAAKVVRHRELALAVEAIVDLTRDDVLRVRVAAARALAVVGEGEHAGALMTLMDDPEAARAAEQALDELSLRLDRRF